MRVEIKLKKRETGWIPVHFESAYYDEPIDQTIPVDNQKILVTVEYETAISHKKVREVVQDIFYVDADEDGFLYSTENNWYDVKQITAWMPLPDPHGEPVKVRGNGFLKQMGPCGESNADVIRKMDDKELFNFLSRFELGDIDYALTFCDMCENGKTDRDLECSQCLKSWLLRDANEWQGLKELKGPNRWKADDDAEETD